MSSSHSNPLDVQILLIDLPVFPKGVLSLGLPILASALGKHFTVSILDLNQQDWDKYSVQGFVDNVDYVGLKVSSQNFDHAVQLTADLKKNHPNITVVWGGELPSLLPDKCLEHADTIVTRRIEGCLPEFVEDIRNGSLKQKYEGSTDFAGEHHVPALNLQLNKGAYYSFMGMPLETSAGCDRFCRFCMVHTMQPGVKYKLPAQIADELKQMDGQFLNVLDYNIAVSKDHVLAVCREFEKSGITGWMGEMCLESLDDEETLIALKSSRCKMIYCGLESLSEEGLESVNKHKTNHPENYRRIIRKAQSYGVNIGSGFIIGLDGASQETFDQMLDFYNEMGIEYVKFTFLTYNPGTYFYEAMKRSGEYTTDDISKFDGNHLTYLAKGLNEAKMYARSKEFIKQFYSLSGIISRSGRAHTSSIRRLEQILFNVCFRQAYMSWLKHDVLEPQSVGIKLLMNKAFSKSLSIKMSEWLLEKVRMRIYKRQYG